jgi:hypothetical protein
MPGQSSERKVAKRVSGIKLNLFLFIFWLLEVFHLIGMTPSQAVFATSLYPLGRLRL